MLKDVPVKLMEILMCFIIIRYKEYKKNPAKCEISSSDRVTTGIIEYVNLFPPQRGGVEGPGESTKLP